MGRRGPAAAPAGLRLINGRAPGRDSGGRKVPQPPGFIRQAPECTSWLPQFAREMWEHTAPELESKDLLKSADLGVLASYCVAWDQLKRAVPLYEKCGMLITNKRSGAVKPNPAVAIARAAIRDLLLCARELGCSPSG